MTWFLAIPLPLRLTLIAVVGLLAGGQINRAVYRLAWNARPIGPWSPPDPAALPRRWWDRIPIVGWFGLAREEPLHGTLYWFRPLAVEVACGVGLPVFYQWQLHGGSNDWSAVTISIPMVSLATIHAQFLTRSILFSLMLAASLIDFDEKIIPDGITVPGTLIGFVLAAMLTVDTVGTAASYNMLSAFGVEGNQLIAQPLLLTTPLLWRGALNGPIGLAVAIGCVLSWWIGLLPRTIYFRGGIIKGIRLLFASWFRHAWSKRITRYVLPLTILFVILVWNWGGPHWAGLLTSLVGMLFGGGLVWSFRVVASSTLRQEALGFGDVTLMGMIGAFVGWQPSLLIFFLAPFAGVIVAVAQWVITRRHEIAYGPYLCLATAGLVLGWTHIWAGTWQYFYVLGIWVPIGLLACLVAMAVMLSLWVMIKRRWLESAAHSN